MKLNKKIKTAYVVTALLGGLFVTPAAFAGDTVRTETAGLNTQYLYKKGVSAFEDGNYHKAQTAFSTILYSIPRDANTNYYMARVRAMRGDHKGAIKNYSIALAGHKGNAILMAGLGQSYAKADRLEDARAILEKLETASVKCAGTCSQDHILKVSIEVVTTAMDADEA